MNKIDQLLKKYCPNGVEEKPLFEIANILSGLSGKKKDDFNTNLNCKYVDYLNVYNNLIINTNDLKLVHIDNSKEHPNELKYGDVIFTASSETQEECGINSLFKSNEKQIYLNSFCFILRFNNLNLFNVDFLKYIFKSDQLRKQIIRSANGTTRFNISKELFKKIILPIPPIEIQNKIAEILDNFSELEAELEAELEFRNIQYEHYNNKLLDFDNNQSLLRKLSNDNFLNKEVKSYKLKDISKINIGQQLNKELFNNGEYFVYNGGVDPSGKYDKWNVEENYIAISQGGESAGNVKFIKEKFWAGAHCYYIFSNNEEKYNQKYLYYFLKNEQPNLANKANGVAIKGLSKSALEDFEIKVPSIEIQNRIVKVLEKLETYNKDVNTGLPAELNVRKSQYNYYLNKLLTFKTGGGNR